MNRSFKDIKFELISHVSDQQPTPSLVAKLTLNRPKRGNAISMAMASELVFVFRYLNDTKEKIRALVLTGEGKFFCTGMDLQQAPSASASEDSAEPPDVQQMFVSLARLAIPTICLLNGPALGGGVGLFFACDIRISTSPRHYLSLPESKRGLVPALIGPLVVAELGKTVALEMMFGGGVVPASRLYSMQVISAILGDETTGPLTLMASNKNLAIPSFKTAQEAVAYYLDMIVGSAPTACKNIKAFVRRLGVEGQDWDDKLALARRVFQEMMSSAEASVGMMAFMQKQVPDWNASL